MHLDQNLVPNLPDSTAVVLNTVGLNTTSDYCYCKLRFNGTHVSIIDTMTEHCYGGTGKLVLLRSVKVATWLIEPFACCMAPYSHKLGAHAHRAVIVWFQARCKNPHKTVCIIGRTCEHHLGFGPVHEHVHGHS